jgi:hypothetical protein
VVGTTVDPTLVERVRRGDYEVDAHAVAEAMIRRWKAASAVLVAPEALDEPSVRAHEDEPESGGDVP